MGFGDYVREFGVVEVQQTFYEPPRDATLRRWRAQAPPGFEFTLKAWQLVTHDATSPTYRRLRRPLRPDERAGCGSFRDTPIVREAWQRTLECARLLRATAVLLQCPASFRPTGDNIARLRAFVATAPRPDRLRLLWEPRGAWPPEVVEGLCRELGLVHVVDPLVHATVTPEQTYFRLHGTTGARHVHTDEELRRVLGLLPVAPEVAPYVMFNNLPRVGDARRFRALLREQDERPAAEGSVPGEDVARVCDIAADRRDDATLGDLIADRYAPVRRGLSEDVLAAAFSERPDAVASWQRYSEDKRTGCGWALSEREGRWLVSEPFGDGPAVEFDSPARACAAFVLRELDFWAARA